MTSGDLLERIGNVGRTITGGLERPLNLNAILEAVIGNLGADRAFVITPDQDGGLRVAGSAGLAVGAYRSIDAKLDLPDWAELMGDVAAFGLVPPELASKLPETDAETVEYFAKIDLGQRAVGLLIVRLMDKVSSTALPITASMIAQCLRVERVVSGERERLREENLHLKQELKEKYEFTHLIGKSNEMRQVYEQVSQVARSNATVLLRGESGTGKEMIANAIHYNSLRSKRAFVKINCAALPDTLIESELFGHERGAFTGADKLKRGRFEMADGGTLFLDEVGDLPMQTQIKLLRVLQEREFERLGGTETIRANIRLITATNKNLEEAIANGEFREDLYYRLNVFSIFLPPLRERKSDILLLAEHFLERYEAEHGKRIRRISTPAIDMLMSYHYPGNVRELENAIERAVLVCDSNVIHGHHLPPTLQTAEVSGTQTHAALSSAVAAFERDLIVDTLKSTSGNIAQAARDLESTERILGYKIKKYAIDSTRFRK